MNQPMNKKAEQQLLDAVKMVTASVEAGDDPNGAVTKTAQDMKLGRAMIPLVVQAYNVGRTTFQREHGGPSILDKQAEFPIAHLETIVGQIYPQNPKSAGQLKKASAVDSAYGRPPTGPARDDVMLMEKVAEVPIRMTKEARPASLIGRSTYLDDEGAEAIHYGSPQAAIKNAFVQKDRAEHNADEAGYEYRVSRDKYLAAMGAIGEYFKEAQPWRLPFAEVEWNATQRYGPPAKHALSYAYERNGMTEKRASGPPSLLRAVDWNAGPYRLIKNAIDCGRAMIEANRSKTATEVQGVKQVEAAFRPFEPAPSEEPLTPYLNLGTSPPVSFAKRAGFLGNLASVGVGTQMRSLGAASPSRDDLVGRASDELSDPSHMQELKDIETRAMLSDMLNNDEVISGYEPDEVFDAFNEISKLSPRTANQPAVIRPLLRNRLTQGAVAPFEAQQIADLEKTVGQTQGMSMGGSGGDEGSSFKTSEALGGKSIL